MRWGWDDYIDTIKPITHINMKEQPDTTTVALYGKALSGAHWICPNNRIFSLIKKKKKA